MTDKSDRTLLPHVIICGNPGEGFELYGPFPNFLAAVEHADQDGDLPEEWWVMPIHPVADWNCCDKCGSPLKQADIDGGRCTACGTMLLPKENK